MFAYLNKQSKKFESGTVWASGIAEDEMNACEGVAMATLSVEISDGVEWACVDRIVFFFEEGGEIVFDANDPDERVAMTSAADEYGDESEADRAAVLESLAKKAGGWANLEHLVNRAFHSVATKCLEDAAELLKREAEE